MIRIINNAGITLSCVAIGSGCNDQLLNDLATQGGGRIFYSDNTTDLPKIFAQEVFLASNTYIVNEVFTPEVTSNDKIIREVVKDGMPELYGYVATMKKERSIDLLESFQHDPILSYWQYGLGKTVAWTSDVSGEWSAEYSNWDNTPLLWHNIIKLVSEDNGMEGTYANVEQNGNKATITYTTEEYSANTKVVAIVYDEEGNPKEIELDPTKPGVYETQIDTKDTGIYTINVQQREQDEIVSSINTAAIMQYSLEYRFYPENTLLDEFAASTGGIFIDKPDEVFKYSPEFVKARFNLWLPLLIIASLLFLYDIAVRRFHLSFSFVDKIAAKRAKKKALNEEKKRKEEAQVIKNETAVTEKEEEKSGIVTAATTKKADNKPQAPKGKIRQYVNENPQTPYNKPVEAPKDKAVTSNAQKNAGTDTAPSFASLKNPSQASEKAKTETRVFERKDAAPVYFKDSSSDKKKTDNTNPKKPGDSVTSAALKTRVWVREDDK